MIVEALLGTFRPLKHTYLFDFIEFLVVSKCVSNF